MITVLFVRDDSVYKTIPGCDPWDKARDAMLSLGDSVVIAHPPCRTWGRLRHFAACAPSEEHGYALWAVAQVRKLGGVLEHPAASILWAEAKLPLWGEVDSWGGWTMGIEQWWFGHRAQKKTLLYIVGCQPSDIPPYPFRLGEATHVIQTRKRSGQRPDVSKAEREHTPLALALWLVQIALRCRTTATRQPALRMPT
jgi:hypothetical protein